jgi:GntR family transcriptional repressor for pyruvate dehydrogenase complex
MSAMPVPRPLEYERVAGELRQMIVEGELRPGDRLPAEGELTARMGVSRGTLREALRVLSSQKLLTSARGVNGGTFVAEPSTDDVVAHLETSLTLLSRSVVSVGNLLEMRGQLEVPAAELAARRRTEEDLHRLETSVGTSGEPGLGSSVGCIDLDGPDAGRLRRNSDFHLHVLRAAGNPVLEMTARPVFSVLSQRFRRDQPGPGFWTRVTAEHAEILEQVRDRNSRGARRAMRSHLAGLRETYIRIDVTRPHG